MEVTKPQNKKSNRTIPRPKTSIPTFIPTSIPKPCDIKSDSHNIRSSCENLYDIITDKDKQVEELNNRIKELEEKVQFLQENIKEKNEIIDARTQAISLMSESLHKERRSSVFDYELNPEKQKLLDEIVFRDQEIETLQEINKKQEQVIKAHNKEIQSKLQQQNMVLREIKDQIVIEKHKVCIKIDDYMRENTELIERLEKINNNRIASSESIEIVDSELAKPFLAKELIKITSPIDLKETKMKTPTSSNNKIKLSPKRTLNLEPPRTNKIASKKSYERNTR